MKKVFKDLNRSVKERVHGPVIAHFFIYAAGKVALSGISFIMAPIMMVLLSPHDYGLLSLIHVFNNIAIACSSLGLPQVLMVNYVQVPEQNKIGIINAVLTTYCLVAIPLMIINVCCPSLIQRYLFLSADQYPIVIAVLLICFLSFFNDLMLQLLQFHRYALWVTIIQLIVGLVTAVGNFVALGCFHGTIVSVLYIQLLMVIVVFCASLYLYCKNRYYTTLDFSHLFKKAIALWRVSIPFLPGLIVGWLFALLNRWMLAKYAGLDVAGIFAVADAGGQLVYRLVLHPLQGAYGPALLRSYGEGNEDICKIEKGNHSVMILVLISMLGTTLVGYIVCKPLLCFIVPINYRPAIDCIVGVMIGYIFLIGTYFVSNFIQFYKKGWIFIIALSVSILINGLLNYLCIPRYGLSGCVFAMAVAYGIYFIILWGYNLKMIHYCTIRYQGKCY